MGDNEKCDRADGRQLAGLSLGLGFVTAVVGGALSSGLLVGIGGGGLLVGALAWLLPVHAIRLVMGRWTELFPTDHADDAQHPLAAGQDGVPLQVAAAEQLGLSQKFLARLGIGLMVFVLGASSFDY